MPITGDFYEDDEPLDKIRAAWEHAPKQLTTAPPESWRPGATAPEEVVVRLDPDLRAALAARVNADHTNASDVIRQALRAWLDVA